MSYSRTVRCGYCYAEGHNRLGCPERRRIAEENPNSYEGQKYLREQSRRAAQIKSRRCTYCNGNTLGGKENHNRTGCELRKRDVAKTIDDIVEFRRTFVEHLKRIGLGVGSVIHVPTKGANMQYGINYLVDGFDWDKIDHSIGHHHQSRIGRWSSPEPMFGRVMSHNIPQDFQDHWHGRWLTPMHRNGLSIDHVDLGDLTTFMNSEEVFMNYKKHSPEQVQIRVVAKMAPQQIVESIPKNFFTVDKLSPSQKERFGLDEGPRPGWFHEEK